MARLDTAQAMERLAAAGIWHEQVVDYDGLRQNPQVAHLAAFTEAPTAQGTPMVMLAHPVRYDGQTPPVRRTPPALGQHSREILTESGFKADQIDQLLASGVVVQSDRMRG